MVNPVSSAPTAPQGLILNQLSIISAIPKPALGIGTYVGQPAVYYPDRDWHELCIADDHQSDLGAIGWLSPTVFRSAVGVVTNPPANAFFRLQ